MCGIVGAVSTRNIIPVLLEGLKRLEYRGYDSCGVAYIRDGVLKRARSIDRVAALEADLASDEVQSPIGIAHTRWATHGVPAVHNAHPHFSNGSFAIVHNGIIENHDELRNELKAKGYTFSSQTDTEVIAHLIADAYEQYGNLSKTVRAVLPRLRGAYALAIMAKKEPGVMVGARHGSPLVLGVGTSENFLASDAMALAGTCNRIVYLEEGDIVDLSIDSYNITHKGVNVDRPVKTVEIISGGVELGPYRHYMQKEIFEQPAAIGNTLDGITSLDIDKIFGAGAEDTFKSIDNVLILACGTSYYAGSVAKYWIEAIAGVRCNIEVASEYRYRKSVPDPKTLIVTISQSGETADTIAALKHAASLGMDKSLTICNVATSAMVRECKHAFITRAGREIGVASTKAFTTQLVGLYLLTQALKKTSKTFPEFKDLDLYDKWLEDLRHLPMAVQGILALEPQIIAWAEKFSSKQNALFLGRGHHYPIALEGALKLKEISYIHAEAYSAGELKHGPLALVTKEMPVVVVAPNDELIEKLKSNMQEVRARGGELFVFADAGSLVESDEGTHVIHMPENYGDLSPILHVITLQLLAYHTACIRGTDVDKPRNLAKSVTVE